MSPAGKRRQKEIPGSSNGVLAPREQKSQSSPLKCFFQVTLLHPECPRLSVQLLNHHSSCASPDIPGNHNRQQLQGLGMGQEPSLREDLQPPSAHQRKGWVRHRTSSCVPNWTLPLARDESSPFQADLSWQVCARSLGWIRASLTQSSIKLSTAHP